MEKTTFQKLGTDSRFMIGSKECIVESRKGSYMIYYETENRLKQKSIHEGEFNKNLKENYIKILSY